MLRNALVSRYKEKRENELKKAEQKSTMVATFSLIT